MLRHAKTRTGQPQLIVTVEHELDPIQITEKSTLRQVLIELNRNLTVLYGNSEERFSMFMVDTLYFPEILRWIACYAVRGDSEGHYIHVDTVRGEERKSLFCMKTFNGFERAEQIANIAQFLLTNGIGSVD